MAYEPAEKSEVMTAFTTQGKNNVPPVEAAKNAQEFVKNCLMYYPCPENYKIMTDYMVAEGIPPTLGGFHKAYYELRDDGYLKQSLPAMEGASAQAQQQANLSGMAGAFGFKDSAY